jgi:hypothetical protein
MKKYYIILMLVLISVAKVFAQGTVIDSTTMTAITQTSSSLQVTLLNQAPDPATAGNTVKLAFMVENTGGQAIDNLALQFIPSYPFYAIPGEEYTKKIATLTAHQIDSNAVIFKFTVGVDKDAIEGTNVVKIRETTGSTSYDQPFNVDVTGQKFAQIIYIDKAKISPGNETELKFTITNTGNSPLQNLIFSWSEENSVLLPVYSDNTKYIKNLDVGQSVDLPYTVVANVNAAPGLYLLNLDLKFQTENGTSKEIATKSGISIGGETDFDVAFSQSSAGQTSLSVANIGNTPAYSVTVSIPRQENFRVTGQQSSIIGNLDKGDYTLVSFQLSSPFAQSNTTQNNQNSGQANGQNNQGGFRQFRNATGSGGFAGNSLQVQIDYTDTTGARRTVMKNVPVQLTASTAGTFAGRGQQSQSSIFSSPLVIAGIVIVIIIGGLFYYRRRKSMGQVSRRK